MAANRYVVYDPGVQAYREVDVDTAKAFVISAEAVKAKLIENGDW